MKTKKLCFLPLLFLVITFVAITISFSGASNAAYASGEGVYNNYIITGNSTDGFSAIDKNPDGEGSVGIIDGATVASVVTAIDNARYNGTTYADCDICFGDGTDYLDIGESYVSLSHGKYTLRGSLSATSNSRTLLMYGDASVVSYADVKNDFVPSGTYYPIAIEKGANDSTGTLTISGGGISSYYYGIRIQQRSQASTTPGETIINGGDISILGNNSNRWAVYTNQPASLTFGGSATIGSSVGPEYRGIKADAGTLAVTGGSIYTSSTSIYTTCETTLSGGTVVSSSASSDVYAVYSVSNYASLTISGTVQIGNSTGANNGVYKSGNTLNISGGTITVNGTESNCYAVYLASGAQFNLSGGTITSYGTRPAIYNFSGGYSTIGGGTVTAAGKAYYSNKTLSIEGGTITSTANYAVDCSGAVLLNNAPTISGYLADLNLSVALTVTSYSGSEIIDINWSGVSADTEIVGSGITDTNKNKFDLASDDWGLTKSTSTLVASERIAIIYYANDTKSARVELQKYISGASLLSAPSAPDKTGYSFDSWAYFDYVSDAAVSAPSTVETKLYAVPQYSENSALFDYTVKHYLQNLNDNDYPSIPNEFDSLQGLSGATTAAEANTYVGFTVVAGWAQTTVTEDGNAVVSIYYARNVIDINYVSATGTTGTITKKFGATLASSDLGQFAGCGQALGSHYFLNWYVTGETASVNYFSGGAVTVGSDEINLSVNSVVIAVTGISTSTPPTKTTYSKGDELDVSGLTIAVTYNRPTAQTPSPIAVDESWVSGFSTVNACSDGEATITYRGETTTFDYIVLENYIVYLVISPEGYGTSTYSQLGFDEGTYTVEIEENVLKIGNDDDKFSTASATAGNSLYNYSFVGYTLNSEALPQTLNMTQNITVYVNFARENTSFTVSFNTNGGSTNPSDITDKWGSTVTLPTAPTKDGYEFGGWYLSDDNGATLLSEYDDLIPQNNVTVFAKWDRLYSVSIAGDLPGGLTVNNLSKTQATEGTAVSFGISCDSQQWSGVPVILLYADSTTHNVTLNSTLYRFYMPAQNVTVTYNADSLKHLLTAENSYILSVGGTTQAANTESAYVLKDEIAVLSVVARTGYYLSSWTENDTPIAGETSDSLSYTMPSQSVTVKAVYSAKQTTVTYDVNGGNALSPTTYLATFGQNYSIAAPTHSTKYFGGWKCTISSIEHDVALTGVWAYEDEALTLVADWKDYATYSVTFSGGTGATGTAPTIGNQREGATFVLPSNSLEKTGYTFDKWSDGTDEYSAGDNYTMPAAAVVFSATWKINNYSITWKNAYNTTIYTEQLNFGVTPSYDTANFGMPQKTSTAQYDYSFTGWSPEVVAASKDEIYTATFDENLRSYTVTWKNADTTLLDVNTVNYGVLPSFSGATPTKAPDNTYTYQFVSWSPTVSPVSGNTVYTATFTSSYINYCVTFYAEDGETVVSTKSDYHFGDSVVVPTAPDKPNASFAAWSPVVVASVSGNATYTATYTDFNKYTVTWKNTDNTLLEVDTNVVEETIPTYNGATPTKAPDNTYTYQFVSWSPTVSPVSGNAVYTATFTSSYINYCVTFYAEDGETVVSTKSDYHFGDSVVVPTAPQKPGYKFTAWSPAPSTVAGNADYTAGYTALSQYTVTVTDGTISGCYGLSAIIYENGTVTVVADVPVGKVFDGWFVGETRMTTETTYTFVPTSDISLVAKYSDSPSGEFQDKEEKTLSGGAIAGIAVGSAVAFGFGGFSLVWFGIKKKTFGDIIALFKKK